MRFDVVIEIPKGQRNKYEIDHQTGRIRLSRTLFTSMVYPADYGYVEGTLAEDGDPLDALSLHEEPTVPGCLVLCRPIAVLEMLDQDTPDDKVICVPAEDPRYDQLQDVSDLPLFQKESIQHFFESYKALEPGKEVEVTGWAGRQAAEKLVTAAFERTRLADA